MISMALLKVSPDRVVSLTCAGGREATESPFSRPDVLTPLEYPPGELNTREAVTPAYLVSV
jgi:hypothetical protein